MTAHAAPKPLLKPNETACCMTDAGVRVCGDTFPDQCNGRAIQIYNRQGLQIRAIAARMTQEEKAAIAAKERKEKEERLAVQEQRRKDQALLDTYSSVRDIDQMEDRAQSDIKKDITDLFNRISSAQKKRREMEQQKSEAESLSEYEKSLRIADKEIEELEDLLASKRKDLNQVRQRYDRDRKRYLELIGGRQQ